MSSLLYTETLHPVPLYPPIPFRQQQQQQQQQQGQQQP